MRYAATYLGNRHSHLVRQLLMWRTAMQSGYARRKLAAALAGGLAAGALADASAAPASADYDTAGYVHALDEAGLINPSKFTFASDALSTGCGSANKSSRAVPATPSCTTSATARACCCPRTTLRPYMTPPPRTCADGPQQPAEKHTHRDHRGRAAHREPRTTSP